MGRTTTSVRSAALAASMWRSSSDEERVSITSSSTPAFSAANRVGRAALALTPITDGNRAEA